MKDLLKFIKELKKAFEEAFIKIKAEQERHEKVLSEHREHTKNYTAEALRKEHSKIMAEHNTNMSAIRNNVFNLVESMRKEYDKAAKAEYMPQGSALNTDDIALMQSGIVLKEQEVEVLVEKHKGNNTMMRVIEKYVLDNKIKVSSNLHVIFSKARNMHEVTMNAYDTFSCKAKNLVDLMKYNAPDNEKFVMCNEKITQYMSEYEKQIQSVIGEN